ncbi:hypothetical protein JTB14_017565 [Gonioctena quinquepunctata]|nr:hypothetical protein JTB14_017565 [Gonioctena quinquepunctata]
METTVSVEDESTPAEVVERQPTAETCHTAEEGPETEALFDPEDVTLTESTKTVFDRSFNAAHLGGARACEAGFHPITPRRHDINKENNKQRNLQRRKKTTKKANNEERKQRRKKPSTKKETIKEERNQQRKRS